MRLRPFLLLVPFFLSACGSAGQEAYPALVPVDTLLAEEPLTPSPAPELEARAAALRARAAALRAETP
ncbi:hypothetical protein [Rhodobacter maris]|uniref:Beta-barrel assembly complex subunit BamF n=1 Tax=Rhodobacter maris TaxID=446682 RepID=A0A285S4Y0_9RHOB|nr:hypothetical protein [Rhodobacter maris]SOC02210.1 hypothetical protein SAMN05877831_103106 [Rhodobacter maris]